MEDVVIKGTMTSSDPTTEVEELRAHADELEAESQLIEETITVGHVRKLQHWMGKVDKKLDDIPKLESMLVTITSTQRSVSQALVSFAETFKRAEDRAESLDSKFQEVITLILNKDNVPANHVPIAIVGRLMVLSQFPTVVMAICVVAAALYYAQLQVDANATGIKVTTTSNTARIDKIEDKVEDTAAVVEKAAEVLKIKEAKKQ